MKAFRTILATLLTLCLLLSMFPVYAMEAAPEAEPVRGVHPYVIIDDDATGGYEGDYVVIYNPATSSSTSYSTGTMTGLIETSVGTSSYAQTRQPANSDRPYKIDVDSRLAEYAKTAEIEPAPEGTRASYNVGSTKTGINMDAVRLMGDIIKQTAEETKEKDSLGCAKLVVLCNAPDDNPFMAGAFHGVSEADAIINVGVSGPGVVKYALEQIPDANFELLCETIKRTAFKITRVGQLVAQEASSRLGVPFGIIDLSLAPTPAIGDSVADILKCIGVEHPGAPGTTAALALLNDQVKKGGVMASSYVGGLSGAFIPVSEDQGMIDAVEAGALTIEKLEAMTCVCSVGLDMIAIPGDTPATTIAGIIADESAIGMVNQKTTAVRIIPVVGKTVGDTVQFGGLLGYAPIMPVNTFSSQRFVDRGGRIPAPIHSFKN